MKNPCAYTNKIGTPPRYAGGKIADIRLSLIYSDNLPGSLPTGKASRGTSRSLGGFQREFLEGVLDFSEVALVWKFSHRILPKQTSKRFASEPPKLLRSPSRSGSMRKLVRALSYLHHNFVDRGILTKSKTWATSSHVMCHAAPKNHAYFLEGPLPLNNKEGQGNLLRIHFASRKSCVALSWLIALAPILARTQLSLIIRRKCTKRDGSDIVFLRV